MNAASSLLAQIVAKEHIQRLALIGLAKNVGKTTATNALLQALIEHRLYEASELALTSLGLDGEATDAMTGLPKPRYVPQAGLLVATTNDLLRQAEGEGARFERLQQLPGRTALGAVQLARVLHPGKVVIAGPTLLRDLRFTLDLCSTFGARLGIIDGAINRLGAAAPSVTDASILCVGASIASTPELAARRVTDVVKKLQTSISKHADAYKKLAFSARLLCFHPNRVENHVASFQGIAEPDVEASWIVEQMRDGDDVVYFLHGALTEELTRALLAHLPQKFTGQQAELVVEDATKIFCHSVTIERLATRRLNVRVASLVRILAMTINPFTPEYSCTSQDFLAALIRELPENIPPVIDVVADILHA